MPRDRSGWTSWPPSSAAVSCVRSRASATGRAVAGRIGPREQAKVTVFGPVVNLASRLETMTKQLRVPILVDEATAELEIADIYLELNLAAEARALYEKIAAAFARLKMRAEEARARANFGRAAAVLKDIETARRQLKKAARLYRLEKNAIGAAVVKRRSSGISSR